MKLHGKKIEGPNVEICVIPRQDDDLVFKAQAVLDFDDFESLCPSPQPPVIMKPGGEKTIDVEDEGYLKNLNEWARKRTDWMMLKSLEATPGLEWETVDKSDNKTWNNFRDEMRKAGLSSAEISRIVGAVTTACGLNQEKIDEATRRFLADQEAALESSTSQTTEQQNMPSGEPVNASV